MENLTYLVISAGRCGGTLCSLLLNNYVHRNTNIQNKNSLMLFKDKIEIFESNTVYHSHFEENLDNIPENVIIVFPTRNIFNTVISDIFAKHIQKHHFFNNLVKLVDSFSITPADFIKIYIRTVEKNIAISEKLEKLPNKIYRIKYEDFENDNDKLYNLLDIDYDIAKVLNKTVKTPYNYKEVIDNFNILIQIADELDKFDFDPKNIETSIKLLKALTFLSHFQQSENYKDLKKINNKIERLSLYSNTVQLKKILESFRIIHQ